MEKDIEVIEKLASIGRNILRNTNYKQYKEAKDNNDISFWLRIFLKQLRKHYSKKNWSNYYRLVKLAKVSVPLRNNQFPNIWLTKSEYELLSKLRKPSKPTKPRRYYRITYYCLRCRLCNFLVFHENYSIALDFILEHYCNSHPNHDSEAKDIQIAVISLKDYDDELLFFQGLQNNTAIAWNTWRKLSKYWQFISLAEYERLQHEKQYENSLEYNILLE